MLERRQQDKKPQGRIEMYGAYLGCEHSGKRRRGLENKISLNATVEVNDDGKPVQTRLRRVVDLEKRDRDLCEHTNCY